VFNSLPFDEWFPTQSYELLRVCDTATGFTILLAPPGPFVFAPTKKGCIEAAAVRFWCAGSENAV